MPRLLILIVLFLATPLLAQDLVTVRLASSKGAVSPGDQFALAAVFELAPGYHLHTNEPVLPPGLAFTPIATEVEVLAEGLPAKVWPNQWPQPHTAQVYGSAGLVPYEVFDGRVAVYIPLAIHADAVGSEFTARVRLAYQACDDKGCLMPEDAVLEIRLPMVPLGTVAENPLPVEPELFAGFDPSVFASATEESVKKVEFVLFGRTWSLDPRGFGLVLLFLAAALGGLILNITPCVLPVIPIKIMGISSIASNPAKCFFYGAIMSLGLIAFWLGLGLAIALISGFSAINQLFQYPWFSLGVGAFIAIMGVGMVGLFSTGLPPWVYAINPRHDTIHGAFIFGIMTAILSTPCTAPFMGAAAAWATQQATWIVLVTFTSIGVGMALPYMLLSANPRWVARIPRTGPASSLVKQVMGLFLLAVSAFFIGTGLDPLIREPIDPATRFHWYIIAAIAVAACAWLTYRTFRIARRPLARGIVTLIALPLSGGLVAFAIEQNDRGPIDWVYYTPARFADAVATGDVVVVDFTAEWCLNCKALEAAVLHRGAVAVILNGEGVTPIKVDITGGYPAGTRFMREELQWPNVPLLAFFGPGLDEPIKFDTYTPATVLEAIERARGRVAARPEGE